MEFDDHDPWNEPSHRHARAQELIQDEVLWDCVNELAPFGSDEGAEAYVEYRRWRADSPESNLVDCISWILNGREEEYKSMSQDAAIGESGELDDCFGYADTFTLDSTIIATVLGQLVDEGRIDTDAKPFANVAIARQCHRRVVEAYGDESIMAERLAILESVRRVIDAA